MERVYIGLFYIWHFSSPNPLSFVKNIFRLNIGDFEIQASKENTMKERNRKAFAIKIDYSPEGEKEEISVPIKRYIIRYLNTIIIQ